MTNRPHWSYNQLSKYLRCPLQYYFEYVLELPRPFVSSGQALGSAVHEALATFHRSIQTGRPSDAATVKQAFHSAWQEREAREVIRFDPDEDKEDLQDQGEALIDAYLAEPSPEDIIAVEQTIISPICTSEGEILEKPLLSVLDLLVHEPAGLTIVDFKTSGRSLSATEAAMSLQATCYVNAVANRFEEAVRFRFTVLVKTKTPRIQHVEARRTAVDLCRLGDLVQAVEKAIAAASFYPVETPMNCSTCPYREPCREWSGSASQSHRIGLPQVNEALAC